MTQDQEQPPTPFAALFGDLDGDPPDLFTDQGPSPRSSARQHAQRRLKNDREAPKERQTEQLKEASIAHGDEQAFDRAMVDLDQGREPSHEDRIRAARELNRRGTGMSSAQFIGQQALRRRRTPRGR